MIPISNYLNFLKAKSLLLLIKADLGNFRKIRYRIFPITSTGKQKYHAEVCSSLGYFEMQQNRSKKIKSEQSERDIIKRKNEIDKDPLIDIGK